MDQSLAVVSEEATWIRDRGAKLKCIIIEVVIMNKIQDEQFFI